MSKRVVLTFEVSFMSVICLERISCVLPSFVLHCGHLFGLSVLTMSIISGTCIVYPLWPFGAPKSFGNFLEFGLIFRAFFKLETVKACVALFFFHSLFFFSHSF